MVKAELTRSIFEMLVKHLVDIEDERDRILIDYFPNMTKQRDSFHQLINHYIESIENYINNAEILEAAGSGYPIVLIGSMVEIEDLTNKEVESFQIVSPFINKMNINSNCASYLSPLGKALLLKGLGEKIELETPEGIVLYQIRNIRLI